jgi:hypothetical protein
MTILKEGKIAIRHTDRLHDTDIGQFDAIFATTVLAENVKVDAKYIRVYAGEFSAVLKLKSPDGKDAVFVSKRTLKELDDDTIVCWTAASFQDFYSYRLRNDQGQQLLTFGLLIAIIGTLIDGSFAIGKMGITIFTFSGNMIMFLVFAALFLKVAGLGITFYKTILEGK